MIKYDELEEMMANLDIKYFSFVTDNREILTKFKGRIMSVSSFFAVGKLVKKMSVDEYTNTSLKKIEQNGNVMIEQEIKMPEYKFIRAGVFNSIQEIVSKVICEPSMYVFIDSGTTFDSACDQLSSKNIPFLHIKYNHGGFNYNGNKFSSVNSLVTYIMKNYYL